MIRYPDLDKCNTPEEAATLVKTLEADMLAKGICPHCVNLSILERYKFISKKFELNWFPSDELGLLKRLP